MYYKFERQLSQYQNAIYIKISFKIIIGWIVFYNMDEETDAMRRPAGFDFSLSTSAQNDIIWRLRPVKFLLKQK